ncbi:MAG: C-GCAxxG-C-C family protein [Eubacteriaceae bacterium]|nr:C-GCAxxG-C-C family protein [Eubacteriaceae bacterium]
MDQEILEYKLKGYCCSQVMMDMGLKRMGKENQELVDAMGGLCFGMNQGKNCGIVTAAMCILHLADPKEADMKLCRDFFEWFEDAFGTIECSELLEGNPLNKVEKCPKMIKAAMEELSDMLGWED